MRAWPRGRTIIMGFIIMGFMPIIIMGFIMPWAGAGAGVVGAGGVATAATPE
jgi:hypothetical protein